MKWNKGKPTQDPMEVNFTDGDYVYQGQFINLGGEDLYYNFMSRKYHKSEDVVGWLPLPSPPNKQKKYHE